MQRLMNFDGLFDAGSSGALPPYSTGGVPQTRLHSNPAFSSAGLSLGLQTNTDGQGEMSRLEVFNGNGGESETMMRTREDENESRSGGSDNLEGSGDDINPENSRKRKRYHRHTPQQIQELEGLFKECPHPDEKQRMELSKRLNLDPRQVKFWFQNRRTQMKTQIERHENSILRAENDKLRSENLTIREAMRSPACGNCGGPAMLGEVSLEEQHLRIENARLKDELDRVCGLASRFLGRPMSAISSPFSQSPLDLGVGPSDFRAMAPMLSAMGGGDFSVGSSMPPPPRASHASTDRSMLLELALSAMNELVKLAQLEAPLWIPGMDGSSEVLNLEEYSRDLHRFVGSKPIEFISEATRETGIVLINSMVLVDSFMDSNRWAKMFPCIVSKANTIDVISSGMDGTSNGALQLMQAELQVLTPLVPIREVRFLRFCKQHAEGVWAVVDVSVDGIRQSLSISGSHTVCRRLPSGFLVQAMPSGYSKVTWVEHAEYDEMAVHQLYRPPLRAGLGLGARRWLAVLQRQAEFLATMAASPPPPSDNPTAMTETGRRSILRLSGRMTENFYAGVCAWTDKKWKEWRSVAIGEDMVKVMTRQSVDDPGEPSGMVLSAATSVWLQAVSPLRLFEFLSNDRLRCEWDILSNGGPMQEVAHITKGRDHGNAVSLLRATVPAAAASATAPNGNQKLEEDSMLILQETSTDASESLVVYAPVDAQEINLVINGGDSSYVALLPSGFAIIPDGTRGGSLLTIAFQILLTSHPTADLTVHLVDTVKSLFSCTVLKIKSALNCED